MVLKRRQRASLLGPRHAIEHRQDRRSTQRWPNFRTKRPGPEAATSPTYMRKISNRALGRAGKGVARRVRCIRRRIAWLAGHVDGTRLGLDGSRCRCCRLDAGRLIQAGTRMLSVLKGVSQRVRQPARKQRTATTPKWCRLCSASNRTTAPGGVWLRGADTLNLWAGLSGSLSGRAQAHWRIEISDERARS